MSDGVDLDMPSDGADAEVIQFPRPDTYEYHQLRLRTYRNQRRGKWNRVEHEVYDTIMDAHARGLINVVWMDGEPIVSLTELGKHVQGSIDI